VSSGRRFEDITEEMNAINKINIIHRLNISHLRVISLYLKRALALLPSCARRDKAALSPYNYKHDASRVTSRGIYNVKRMDRGMFNKDKRRRREGGFRGVRAERQPEEKTRFPRGCVAGPARHVSLPSSSSSSSSSSWSLSVLPAGYKFTARRSLSAGFTDAAAACR